MERAEFSIESERLTSRNSTDYEYRYIYYSVERLCSIGNE